MVDNITDMHLNKLWEMVEDRGEWHATTQRVTKSHHNLVPEKQQQSRPLNTYADGDCSHEIKRRLLLGRKVMPNLDSILKQRHYFAKKFPSSQSFGFSSSGCESWTIRKAERQRIDAFELW